MAQHRWADLRAGARAMAPTLVGLISFGLVTGTTPAAFVARRTRNIALTLVVGAGALMLLDAL